MTEARGIYLFDEFDAIGADRGTKNDVGEIRRVLNSFLQFLEQDDSDSLILAATNYVGMLDEALFRRFDDVVHYSRPDNRQAEQLIRNHLQIFLGKQADWNAICQAAAGLSHADIARACNDAAKDCVLSDREKIDPRMLMATLGERRNLVAVASPDRE
jgi:SpoVK/Ycf46/Vps4 family AAA+-type ATPase